MALAYLYIGLNDKNQVFEWLSKMVDRQDEKPHLNTDPLFDALRIDARFTDLLKTMKLKTD